MIRRPTDERESGDVVDDPAPWPLIASRHGESMILFRPRYDRVRHPRSGREFERLVLETPDWANVVARTPEGRFVMVRQYRFGSRTVTTEIPGGVVDAGETPEATGRRELLEETGYTAPRWSSLGPVAPNPAIHDNRCHHFLAEGAVPTREPAPDAGEDIQVVLLTPDEVRELVKSGAIDHSLVITALCRVLDLRR